MALLTDGNFYEVAFRQTNDAAWSGGPFSPDIPGYVTANIVNASTFMIYVTSSASGAFAYEGGATFGGWDDALILGTPVGPLTKLTTTDSAGGQLVSGIDSSGKWWVYRPERGFLASYTAPEETALKAFLP